MLGEQMTSTVVRSCRAKNDSTGPRSAVEREKCESTIYRAAKRQFVNANFDVQRHLPGHVQGSRQHG